MHLDFDMIYWKLNLRTRKGGSIHSLTHLICSQCGQYGIRLKLHSQSILCCVSRLSKLIWMKTFGFLFTNNYGAHFQ